MARKHPPNPTTAQADRRAYLFAGVKAEPDDDAPRLVLADWLEDHGDEADRAHAELIRVQCALLRRTAEVIAPERPGDLHALLISGGYRKFFVADFTPLIASDVTSAGLKDRETALLHRPGNQVFPDLPCQHRCSWHRGFASVDLHLEPFRAPVLKAFALGPTGVRVEQVRVDLARSTCASIARNPILSHTVGIQVGGRNYRSQEIAMLLRSPHLATLRRFDIRWPQPELTSGLVDAPCLPSLTHLHIFCSPLELSDCRILARLPLPALQTISLNTEGGLGKGNARALAKAAFFGHLRELNLRNSGLTADGLAVLLDSPTFRCPAQLMLSLNELGAGVGALKTARGLEDVLILDLSHTNPPEALLTQLVASPRLAGLVHLAFRGSDSLGPGVVEALVANPHLSRLASLDLGGCPIGEAGAAALLGAPYLRRLVLTLDPAVLQPTTWAALGERYHLLAYPWSSSE